MAAALIFQEILATTALVQMLGKSLVAALVISLIVFRALYFPGVTTLLQVLLKIFV